MFLFAIAPAAARAQFREADPKGPRPGTPAVQKWRAGMEVTADSGPCRGMVGYAPVPVDWPEQTVRVVEEDVSPGVKVEYETLQDTVKLMVVRIPFLPAGATAKAVVTLEIERYSLDPPARTDIYQIPNNRKLERSVKVFLGSSPGIETRHSQIQRLARQFGKEENAWATVEAIYDWVRDKVEYKNGKFKGALAALRDGEGDCEELTSLFIALCRDVGVPARTVWVQGHCYPEFYLVDDDGNGHWFPCQAAGSRAFGGIPEHRPVLSKIDNFRPPWNPRDPQRYPAEYFTGTGGRPKVKFIREQVAN